uniref:Uncharacterized protein n=1 Tax=Arundo donax TaxID=35708 RepID=A0A0A9DIA7_ARUDO
MHYNCMQLNALPYWMHGWKPKVAGNNTMFGHFSLDKLHYFVLVHHTHFRKKRVTSYP